MNYPPAILVLEDGTELQGLSIGASGTTVGEVVFNTSMTGYQEMLTDPSYAGQILIPTYPLIGNYGINKMDVESNKVQVSGFVVRNHCENPSHPLSEITIPLTQSVGSVNRIRSSKESTNCLFFFNLPSAPSVK